MFKRFDPDWPDDPYLRAIHRDPLGDRAHGWVVAAFCLSIPFGTAPPAIMSIIAAVYALLRGWATVHSYGRLLREPIVWILAAWLAWTAVSLAWTSDPAQGRDELGIFRLHLGLLLGVWPILDRRDRMIRALMLGMIIVAAAQAFSRFGGGIGWIERLAWDRATPGRYPGFLHPGSTALLHALVSVLALGGLLTARRGAEVVFAAVGFAAAAVGMLLTGSRGPWIAAACGWSLAIFIGLAQSGAAEKHKHADEADFASTASTSRRAAIVLGVGIVIAAIAWPTIGGAVRSRIELAREEIQLALRNETVRTDVGRRVHQSRIALELAAERPLIGVGVGGYFASGRALADSRAVSAVDNKGTGRQGDGGEPGEKTSTMPRGDRADSAGRPVGDRREPVLNHAHSSLLHTLATTGLVGLAIYLAFWIVLAVNSMRHHGGAPFGPVMPAAVLTMFVAFLFDSQSLSAPGTAALMLLVAWTAPQRFRPDNRGCDERARGGNAA